MKKLICILLTLIFALSLSACGEDGETQNPSDNNSEELTPVEITVNFDSNGGEGSYQSVKVMSGSAILKPETVPVKDGLIFSAWCLDKDGYSPWDFSVPAPRESITLYAKYGDGAVLEIKEALTVLSDEAKYNSTRDGEVVRRILSNIKATYLGSRAEAEILDEDRNTFKLNQSNEYPLGKHEVTVTVKGGGYTEKKNLEINVVSGQDNKYWLEAKGGAAYSALGYFKDNQRKIGIAPDKYFAISDKTKLSDYTLVNAGARGKSGLPYELLNSGRTLLRRQDPFIIHNLTDEDLYFKPSSQKASYALFDARGALILGYEGETAVMVDEDHPIYATDRLEGASAIFLADKVLPAGNFMLVIDDNNNDGNAYIDKADLPSGVTKTYDADGRKFLNACLLPRVGNFVKLYKGDGAETLTSAYENQLPYILKGKTPLSTMVGVPLIDVQLTDGVEIYDDGGVFGTDRIIAKDKITVKGDVEFNTEGEYVINYTVADDADTTKSVSFSRVVKVVAAPTNQYSKYDVDGVAKYFMYGLNGSNAIKFNKVYNNSNCGFGAFLFDNSAAKYFTSYTPSAYETVQWTSAAVLKGDGSVVYAFNAGAGEVFGAEGKIASIPVNGYNMVADMVVEINKKSNPSYSRNDISDAEIAKFLTDSTGETLYLIVFPNSPNTGNDSQKYGTNLANAFALNLSLKFTVVCDNIKIGL